MSFRAVSTVLRALVAGVFLVGCGAAPAPARNDPNLVVGKVEPAPVAVTPDSAAEDDAMVPIAADDAIRGSRLAPVTIVVFSDYQCPFCGRLEATFDQLREDYGDEKIRFVFKNNPLPFHNHARLAAETGQAVLALAGPEAFWRYHTMAFRAQQKISPETIRTWATSAGVDGNALDQGMNVGRWAAKIERDAALAKRLNANATPMSFINGVLLSGAQPYDKFKVVIDEELEKARSLVERGVPKDKVYARLTSANFTTADKDDKDEDDAEARREARVVHKVPVAGAPARGPATALVTIVEFSDFQCPFCKRAEETLTRIRNEYGDKVRVVWRDTPLPFHPRAEPAAELARAGLAQKGEAGFWTVHDRLFDSAPKLEDADLEQVARDAKLDVAKAMAQVKARAFQKAITSDVDLGDDFQAQGTPHFFINGRRLAGAKKFEEFKVLIDEEIAKAEALVRGGTARTALYETLIKDGKGPAAPEKKTLAPPASTAPWRGTANAKIVIQQVSDFQCPFCARVEGTLDEVLKVYAGQIKIVWRDKPLSFHSEAALAAEAAREAYAQKGNDGFLKMHKLLFANQKALQRQDLDGYAKTIGLDMGRFGKALDGRIHKPTVDADEKAANDAGMAGTPGFLIGPYFLSGAQPFNKFRRLIELQGGVQVRPPTPPTPATPPTSKPIAVPPGTPTTLQTTDLQPGTGDAAKSGDKLKVHYVGKLLDGTVFDESRSRGPFTFTLGQGSVIKGWESGMAGMRVGGKRKLTIPPDLAYGDRGVPPKIPPHATLVFEVELLAIE